MSRVLDTAVLVADGSASRIALELDWYRRLLVDGEAAYELGNVCDTCPFYFERLAGLTEGRSPAAAVVDALREGVDELSPSLLDAVSPVIPAGEYRAWLLDVSPELVWPGHDRDYFAHEHAELFGFDTQWGLPHYPRTPYYRAGEVALDAERGLFEFVVPLVPPRFLSAETVAEYARAGSPGAALALGVFDVKTPAVWTYDRGLPYPPAGGAPPRLHSHWCLVHYLLDGHHKTYAAVEAGRPLRLLSLIALSAGVSVDAELDRALSELEAPATVEE
jgi:hypothetical protein